MYIFGLTRDEVGQLAGRYEIEETGDALTRLYRLIRTHNKATGQGHSGALRACPVSPRGQVLFDEAMQELLREGLLSHRSIT